MEPSAVRTAAAESATSVNDEVAPARAPVDFSRWGCLGAVSLTKRREAQANQPQSFTKTNRFGLTSPLFGGVFLNTTHFRCTGVFLNTTHFRCTGMYRHVDRATSFRCTGTKATFRRCTGSYFDVALRTGARIVIVRHLKVPASRPAANIIFCHVASSLSRGCPSTRTSHPPRTHIEPTLQ